MPAAPASGHLFLTLYWRNELFAGTLAMTRSRTHGTDTKIANSELTITKTLATTINAPNAVCWYDPVRSSESNGKFLGPCPKG